MVTLSPPCGDSVHFKAEQKNCKTQIYLVLRGLISVIMFCPVGRTHTLRLLRNGCSHCGESQIAGPILVFPAAWINKVACRLIHQFRGVSQRGVMAVTGACPVTTWPRWSRHQSGFLRFLCGHEWWFQGDGSAQFWEMCRDHSGRVTARRAAFLFFFFLLFKFFRRGSDRGCMVTVNGWCLITTRTSQGSKKPEQSAAKS